jgi:two-component system OmpR family sensor kinase
VQLAVLAFVAIYVPVLLLLGVTVVTEEADVTTDGTEVTADTTTERSPWVVVTVIALAPAAAALAWWLSGRMMRPIEQAAQQQQDLIEETSHELRTPLAVLTTNAEVLLAHPEPSVEVYREGLQRSLAAAARMQTTIDELLVDARGRARTLKRQPADLRELVEEVVGEVQMIADASEATVALSGAVSAACSIDEATVARAVRNLVDNALRWAPAGSSVEVEVARTGPDATVTVTDHGPGINAEDQAHIFERFWRGDGREGGRDGPGGGRGTGLGLAIARQVARAHGGDLTVQSPGPAGDGSVFELRLRA